MIKMAKFSIVFMLGKEAVIISVSFIKEGLVLNLWKSQCSLCILHLFFWLLQENIMEVLKKRDIPNLKNDVALPHARFPFVEFISWDGTIFVDITFLEPQIDLTLPKPMRSELG